MSDARRSPSIATRRFVESSVLPMLERWREAPTEAEQIEALEAFVAAVSDEGARRRSELEEEIARKNHVIAERDQAIELLQGKVGVLLAENARLRDAMGGLER